MENQCRSKLYHHHQSWWYGCSFWECRIEFRTACIQKSMHLELGMCKWWIAKKCEQKLSGLFNNSSITSWELKQFSKYKWGWVQWLKVGTYACGTCRPTGTLLSSRQSIKLKHGETHQLQKGNQLVTVWFDNCQVAVMSSNFSLNQTVTVRRMKEAPHVKSIPSLRAISTWEVLIWKTNWDLTVPLVAHELGGGDTFCGSSLMLQS